MSEDINKIINRFNRILPHLSHGDHFIDKYNINYPLDINIKNYL